MVPTLSRNKIPDFPLSACIFITLFIFLAACASGGEASPEAPTQLPTFQAALTPAPPTIAAAGRVLTPTAPSVTELSSTSTAFKSTTPAASTPPPGPLSGAGLLAALRGGGYVIIFRHAATDPTPDDASPVVLDDCSTQRNLSAEGRSQSGQIGQAFERQGIPTGQVLASPFCRALDTVQIAFGRAEIEPGLENLETSADESERQTRIDALRRLLATPPDPGTNTILASHGFNISAAAEVSIAEGEAAIFRPDEAGGFTLVATVPSSEWETLETGEK